MSIIGFSEGFHDAAICKIENENILHASHAERYSKVKNDKWLHKQQIKFKSDCDTIAYHEKTWLKNTRRLYTLKSWKKDKTSLEYDKSFYHHQSHAAAGYYTAPFDDCNIIVIDSIG